MHVRICQQDSPEQILDLTSLVCKFAPSLMAVRNTLLRPVKADTGEGKYASFPPLCCDKIFLDERCCAYSIHYHFYNLN